jgi:hypothetical protein
MTLQFRYKDIGDARISPIKSFYCNETKIYIYPKQGYTIDYGKTILNLKNLSKSQDCLLYDNISNVWAYE